MAVRTVMAGVMVVGGGRHGGVVEAFLRVVGVGGGRENELLPS